MLKTSEFSRLRSTSENSNVFNSREIYLVFTKENLGAWCFNFRLAMWVYITTLVLCICLWKVVAKLQKYREICKCFSHFPVPLDHHWFFGIAHIVKGGETYIQVIGKTVDKLQPKAIAKWLTSYYPALDIVHPDTVRAVLKANHTNTPKAHEYRFLLPWLGESLLVSEGKKWAHTRRLLTPAFHFDVLKPYIKTYTNVTDLSIEKIKMLARDTQRIDIVPLVKRATLDTILRCAFSYVDEQIQIADKYQHPFFVNTEKVKECFVKLWMNPFIHNDFIFSLTKDSAEMKKCCNYLHDFSSGIIKLRRQSLADNPSQLKKRHLDFLDILLTAKDDNDTGLSDEQIRSEVDTFVFAGHDTTGSTIMWTLYALAKYPNMQTESRKEVNEIFNVKEDFDYDDLSSLKFTTRFIKESMRMFRPVPSVSKQLAKPLTIDGVEFPPGTIVDINIACLHHNPAVWENHNEFNPDRFLPERFAEKDPFSFLPFAAGQRNCIGQHFAMNEIKVFISHMIRNFEISLDEDKPTVPYRDLVTTSKTEIFLHFKEL